MNKKKRKIYIKILLLVVILSIIISLYNYKIYQEDKNSNISNLTKLYITGDVLKLEDKEEKLKVIVKYKSDDLKFETYATIKLQGHLSLQHPKKNYNIVFYEDETYEQKQNINIKWGSFSKYTLKADWDDSTFTKNVVNSRIAADIFKKYGYYENTPHNGTIDGFPIEIYINDEYHGLYNLNLNKEYMFYEENEKDYTLISGNGTINYANIKQETLEWNYFEVEVGEDNQETLDNLNRVLNFIYNSSDDEFKNEINNYLDLDSLLNYYCFARYAELWDNLSNNFYLLTYDGKLWYQVFYDLNLSHTDAEIANEKIESFEKYVSGLTLWSKLERNFGKELSERYKELRKDVLSKKYIMNKFNEYKNSIPEVAYNNELSKWVRAIDTIDEIEYFIDKNTPITDKYFEELGKK